ISIFNDQPRQLGKSKNRNKISALQRDQDSSLGDRPEPPYKNKESLPRRIYLSSPIRTHGPEMCAICYTREHDPCVPPPLRASAKYCNQVSSRLQLLEASSSLKMASSATFRCDGGVVSRATVGKTITRFEQTGSVKDRVRPGRPATSTTEDRSLDVILSFMENPHQSSRSATLELETSDRLGRRILKINKFHPYKIKLVQELNEDDPDRRVEFFTGTIRATRTWDRIAPNLESHCYKIRTASHQTHEKHYALIEVAKRNSNNMIAAILGLERPQQNFIGCIEITRMVKQTAREGVSAIRRSPYRYEPYVRVWERAAVDEATARGNSHESLSPFYTSARVSLPHCIADLAAEQSSQIKKEKGQTAATRKHTHCCRICDELGFCASRNSAFTGSDAWRHRKLLLRGSLLPTSKCACTTDGLIGRKVGVRRRNASKCGRVRAGRVRPVLLMGLCAEMSWDFPTKTCWTSSLSLGESTDRRASQSRM
ncbi:unnamed protein product, partial [Trichogramma brassicae]